MALPTPGIPEALTRHAGTIEAALKHAVGDRPEPLYAAARYVMGWEDASGRPANNRGKRIRPALCLLAAEAFGGIEPALCGAVAVELIHNFSLVHDEIQDHDAERHHRPTLWARFGEAQAINAGDLLYTLAVRAVAEDRGPAEPRMAALAVLNTAIERMIGGQWADITFETRDDVRVGEYLAMVAGKTGALLAAPLEMGALLAGAPAAAAASVGQWGEHIGLAFQAHDDYLGTWGDPAATGKSNTNDIARRKKTLPIVFGLEAADAAAVIRRVYATDQPAEGDTAAVVAALEGVDAGERTREHARGHIAAATEILAALPVSDSSRAQFEEVADFLVSRDY